MPKTLEQQFAELTKEGRIEEAAVIAVFDQLKAIPPEFMLGKWDGFPIDTSHTATEQPFKWAGKDFRSLDDVDPVMVWGKDGSRTWNADFGHAQVREIKYRGLLTAGMIYDDFPRIDSFRFVDENTVLGAMEDKNVENNRPVWFYMRRM
ncbi:hypothetical protein CH063_08588 [Colletotrichum higginsianum]|uniref:Cytoplasmic protein n=2 Tax=Colletotrichum higginsianum TaxID=80884 RepID=H1VAE0_COLHI|nr:Cytoplasmic protein [Colletotrichum higginsianum IMI 349063]OBR11060.1 Cytoplasmic protein [Colletotrichum higginsianum IMI 349063]TIC90847.1 hypothetical protein CH35J_011355 [Colletotrichum higginsianum]GJD01284.1 cytoplasmic protein [Colletotrichum higginsianum]CCF37193.1 hypothetical protein CH063_08588 [Colletotrichum higginsianum]